MSILFQRNLHFLECTLPRAQQKYATTTSNMRTTPLSSKTSLKQTTATTSTRPLITHLYQFSSLHTTTTSLCPISTPAPKLPELEPQVITELNENKLEETQFEEDLVSFRDKRVSDVLHDKISREMLFIGDHDTVFQAIQQMKDSKVGALLVKDDKGVVVGIFTERDYLNKVALVGLKSSSTLVRDIMTKSPKTVTEKATVTYCMALMTHYRFRHLIVTDKNDEVIGIVSIGDLVKAILEQYKEAIVFLREYIEKRW